MSKFRQAMLDSRKPGAPNNQPKKKLGAKAGPLEEVGSTRATDRGNTFEGATMQANPSSEEGRLEATYGQQAALRSRKGGVEAALEQPGAHNPLPEEEAIDRENRARLAGMSAAEVAAEQAELQQMLPPGVLEALRKRGARKLGAGEHGQAGALIEEKLDTGQLREETSAIRSAGAKKGEAPLRRQPTPLPGAIPEVRKGPLDSLGAISEDAGAEVALGNTTFHFAHGKENPKASTEGVTRTEGTSLRRQPTPLPGAIPKAVKSGGATLEPLAEDEGEAVKDGSAGSESTGGRLLRQPTPMPSAILHNTPERSPTLGVLIEEDGDDESAADEMGDSLLGTVKEVVKEPSGGAAELPGSLARQPTPLPGTIPVVKGLREPALASLEESPEEEEDEARAEVSAEGTSVRLARQPTPLPGAIPSPRTKRGAALAVLEEEGEDEEDMSDKRQGGFPERPTEPVPNTSLPADAASSQSAVEAMEEPGARAERALDTQPQASASMFSTVNASDMRFDLDGALLVPEPVGPGSADISANVAERDILRSGGDPSDAGYTLQEAAMLARSTVPSQRATALRLVAAVLRRAVRGMHGGEGFGSDRDKATGLWKGVWARVWAYALGPDLQLAVVLR